MIERTAICWLPRAFFPVGILPLSDGAASFRPISKIKESRVDDTAGGEMDISTEFCGPQFSKSPDSSSLQFLVPDCGPELRWKSIELGVISWFLDETSDMIFLIKLPGGQIVDSNRSASTKLGYIASELFGMTIFEILPSAASDKLSRFVARSVCADRNEVIDATFRRKIGSLLPVTIKTRMVSSHLAVLAAFPVQEPASAEAALIRSGLESGNATHKLLSETAERERLTKELSESENELSAVPSKLMTMRAEERKEFASEIQGRIEHILAALDSGFQEILSARDRGNPEEAFKLLENLLPALRCSMEETLSACTALKPKTLNNIGMIDTLECFCSWFRSLHPVLRVELEIGLEEEEIPASLKVSIFRIVQEALENVTGHSKAEWVSVSLRKNKDLLELTIAEDGIGMDPGTVFEEHHIMEQGLTRIWERAGLTGGSFSIESLPGKGTTVRCSWPLSRQSDEPA
jgi:PAS domain S-box-containing protein